MLSRSLEIVHVTDEEIQVFSEPSQLDMSSNRELLEFPSRQLRKTKDVIIAIFPSFASSPRAVGDDGNWLSRPPDSADEKIDVILCYLKGVSSLF